MRRTSRVACTVLAALAYVGVSAWNFRAVLPDPSALLPENPRLGGRFAELGRLDQAMVVGVVAGTAHRLVHSPARLRSEGPCHPLPDPYTLGEHMLGEAVLAALPLALSGDPILSYNVLLFATLVVPALAMYALALHFTRSPPAAFVAGLLLALQPARIMDAGHPFVHGDLWAPLALLFLHLTLARGGWGPALGCAAFLGLCVLESLYSLIATLLVLAVYGAYAAAVHRDRVRRWLVPLAAATLVVAALAWLVLHPYLETRAAWDVLVRPGTIFMPLGMYAPGSIAFPGWVLLALVALAVADRLRRRRPEEGEDPRVALVLASGLVLWSSVHGLPLAGFELPSPLLLAKRVVPGLDSVRALASVGHGAILPLALVAAWGVVVLGERLGRRGPVAVATLLSMAVLGERYLPAAAEASFGTPLGLAAYHARPPDEDVRLIREHARGALLDLPYPRDAAEGRGLLMAEDLLFASYSPRPTAACYNSFPSPLHGDVAALANGLPDPAAADALAALGFGTVLVHTDRASPRGPARFAHRAEHDPAIAARLELVGRTERLLAFRLASPLDVGSEPTQLAPAAADAAPVALEPGRRRLALPLRNASPRTFRHPDRIAPREVEARWLGSAGEVVRVARARTLLPLALAPGAVDAVEVEVDTPPPGIYVLTLHATPDAGHLLARLPVAVSEERASRIDTRDGPW